MDNDLEHNNKIARWLEDNLSEQERTSIEKSKELEPLKVVVDSVANWELPSFDVEKGLEKLELKKKEYQRKVRMFWLGAAASVLLLFSSLMWNYYFNTDVFIVTKVAEQKSIVLPKGSKVQLDVVSSIEYDSEKWDEKRIVNLEGQAYFKVTKGVPFDVRTKHGVISVLGTEFNITTNSNVFEVACYTGKVAVFHNDVKTILEKGDQLLLEAGKLSKVGVTTASPNWLQGFSNYKEVLLSEIVNDLEKYYPVEIILPNKYSDLKFTGKVSHKNLELALKNILTPLELAYKEENSGVIVVY